MPLCLPDYPQLLLTGHIQPDTSLFTQMLRHLAEIKCREIGRNRNTDIVNSALTIGGLSLFAEGIRESPCCGN